MKYKFLDDLTSDVMYEAYGKDLKELFSNAALALFEVISDISNVNPKLIKKVELKAENLEELMIAWLQELIARVDTDMMFFSEFDIEEIDETHLKATISGDGITPELGGTVVKAVTYYKFQLEQTKKGYVARVSLDI